MKKLFLQLNFVGLIIALASLCLLQISALDLMASENPQTIYVVISDGDDTIAASHMVQRFYPGYITTLAHAFISSDAFIGAAELYRNLAAKGVRFEYVSGMTEYINNNFPGGLTPFLKQNNFPWTPPYLRASTSEETDVFKKRVINEIIEKYKKQNPNDHLVFIFIGDNGEKDILVYKECLLNNHRAKVTVGATFIHKLYNGTPALELEPGQIPYITFADLALQIRILFPNLLTKDESANILELVSDALSSDKISPDSSRNLTLPHWAEITDLDLKKVDQIFDNKDNNVNKKLSEQVKNLIHQRVEYIRSLSSRKVEN